MIAQAVREVELRPFVDLESRENRERVAERLRSHKRSERDAEIDEMLGKIAKLLELEGLADWTRSFREDRWASDQVRKLSRAIREHSALERSRSEWADFEARYKILSREERKAQDFIECRETGFRVRHEDEPCTMKIQQPISCDIRGCSRCGSRKVQRLVDTYVDRIESLLTAEPWRSRYGVYVLTLTTQHRRTDGERPEWHELESVLKAGSDLGKEHFTSAGRGWLFALELGSKAGMVHLHWIIIAELRKPREPWPISIKSLNDSWSALCQKHNFPGKGGFGFIEFVKRRGGSLRDQVAHVVKYVSKPMDFDPVHFADLFLEVPSSSRWIRSGGILHSGKKPTVRQTRIALAIESQLESQLRKYDDADEIERALRWTETRPDIASARRAEILALLKRDVYPPHRCPTCNGLLYVSYSEFVSSFVIHRDRYISMKECRPPPFLINPN